MVTLQAVGKAGKSRVCLNTVKSHRVERRSGRVPERTNSKAETLKVNRTQERAGVWEAEEAALARAHGHESLLLGGALCGSAWVIYRDTWTGPRSGQKCSNRRSRAVLQRPSLGYAPQTPWAVCRSLWTPAQNTASQGIK